MKVTEFQTQIVPLLNAVHAALQHDDGSITRLTAVGDAMIRTLNFMSEAYDQITDADARTQIEITAEQMLSALAVNNTRIGMAIQSAAELAAVMADATLVTIH